MEKMADFAGTSRKFSGQIVLEISGQRDLFCTDLTHIFN